LLTKTHLERINVVLVSPRNPLNIGAVARAMANFGFYRLTVVAPYDDHWREARSAIGAPELLKNARQVPTLAVAVADCTLVVGTGTLTARKAEQPVVSLPLLGPCIRRELEICGRVALVFGPEKRGLTRADLSYCNLLVEIPTDTRQPSMNLGQAVAVCLYELASRTFAGDQDTASSESANTTANAPAATLDLLAEVIEQTMRFSGYSPQAMQKANRHDLRLFLRRLALNSADAKRSLGVFRRILYRIQHRGRARVYRNDTFDT
jgi:TrmH family RNA methyltransferase